MSGATRKAERAASVERSSKQSHATSTPQVAASNQGFSRVGTACNGHFAKLPLEVRVKIWEFALTCETNIHPSQQVVFGNTFSFLLCDFPTSAAQETVKTLNAMMRTCRLFAADMNDSQTFYKVNTFEFCDPDQMIKYAMAILPERLKGIRNMTVRLRINHSNCIRHYDELEFLLNPVVLFPSLRGLDPVFGGYSSNPRLRFGDVGNLSDVPPFTSYINNEKRYLRSKHKSFLNGQRLIANSLSEIITALPFLKAVETKDLCAYWQRRDGRRWPDLYHARLNTKIIAHGILITEGARDAKSLGATPVLTPQDIEQFYTKDHKLHIQGVLINALSVVQRSLQGHHLGAQGEIMRRFARQRFHERIHIDIPGTERSAPNHCSQCAASFEDLSTS